MLPQAADVNISFSGRQPPPSFPKMSLGARIRRCLIRHRYFRPRVVALLALVLTVSLLWLGIHHSSSSSSSTTPAPPPPPNPGQADVNLLNPVIANAFRAMLAQQQRRQAEARRQERVSHPELDVRHARWPPQEAEGHGVGGEGVGAAGNGSLEDADAVWGRHRHRPVPIPGTDSVISVNTTLQGAAREAPAGGQQEYLRLLQTLMFRRRPPDSAYNINATLSERTPLERPVPDGRQPECAAMTHDVETLPDVSVVVPFFNEPLSMLLRTLHSLLNRTPGRLLREIILVDDASSSADLGVPLEKYLSLVPKVLLVRNAGRLGLIRTRQLGAGLARGAVLVFQDAHTEVNVDWLPPLLEEIVRDRRTIVQPVVDSIHPDTLKYESARMGTFTRSSFTWDLRLVWTRLPDHELSRQSSPWSPFRAPILVGCVIAVDRAFFDSIGGFDPDMNIWGGENFEVPFRTWLCGGRVLTVPCSRVGHTFRKLPYLVGETPRQIERNLLRTAELWMGRHKGLVYGAIPEEYSLNDTDFTSISRRKKELARLGLKCRSFDWFLRTIIPEIPLPPEGIGLFGEVGNFRWTSCLAVVGDGALDLSMTCYMARMLPENYFQLDVEGRLVHVGSGQCARVDLNTNLLYVRPCDVTPPAARWDFRRTRPRAGLMVLTSGGGRRELCLTQTGDLPTGKRLLRMRNCREDWSAQLWLWSYDLNLKRVRGHRT